MPIGHKRPDPARFEKELHKFDEESLVKGGIVFTGSSSVRFWEVKKAFPDLPVLNRGFGGSVANDLIVNAERVVLRYEPKVLVVYTGGNDLHAKLTPKEAFSDYTGFLKMVHEKLPKTLVIVNSVKPAPSRSAEIPQMKELNASLGTWCESQSWITWVQSSDYLLGTDGKPKEELYRVDRLHLNPEGYAKWNAIMDPILRKVWAEAQK